MICKPEDVLEFWLEEVPAKSWYIADDAVDAEINKRFLATWHEAQEGGLGLWLMSPRETLAYIILTDQFSRNLFRGDPRSFALDPAARSATRGAIEKNWDLEIAEPARQFFFLPLEHSEDIADQDLAVHLIAERMPASNGTLLLHAKAHREIIQQFGRFPFRNAALGRENTSAETTFLQDGGYGAIVRRLQGA
jgi:uncharacterized protein (DUF924 family)